MKDHRNLRPSLTREAGCFYCRAPRPTFYIEATATKKIYCCRQCKAKYHAGARNLMVKR